MENMKLRKAQALRGEPRLPADKSLSHRAAMIASLADGPSVIENYSGSEDCSSTLSVLEQLGIAVERKADSVRINGNGGAGFTASTHPLDCGNSGTTMRLMAGILAGQELDSVLTGDASLRSRPMQRIADPLVRMGATVATTEGHAPIQISGRRGLLPIEYRLPIPSAQIKSSVLLAGLFCDGWTSVIEPVPTRDHTERMLEWFGLRVERRQVEAARVISVLGGQRLTPTTITIPSDISAASFFMVGAACLPGSVVSMSDVGLNPTRSAILDVLMNAGANIEMSDKREICNEPVGSIRIIGGISRIKDQTSAVVIEGPMIANLIDEIPIIAVLGTQLAGGLEVRDASELRHKESDRIAAVCSNLRRMGADIVELPDGFRVRRSQLTGSEIGSHGDHRIAMAFAVAALLADGETVINNASCADISFPGFFEMLRSIVV
jgi:3-phosphoshikimate 1-carboxyvinyltransferase